MISENPNKFLEDIICNLTKIRNNEFKLAGFEGKDPVIVKKEKSNKSTLIAANITKSKLARAGKQRMYRKQMKGLDVTQFSEDFNSRCDIISDNIFNIVKEENILPWKKIELKKRKEMFENFVKENHTDLPEDLLIKCLDLIEGNKINFKKYINYDSISHRIISLPILVKENEKYILNYNIKKKKIRRIPTFN